MANDSTFKTGLAAVLLLSLGAMSFGRSAYTPKKVINGYNTGYLLQSSVDRYPDRPVSGIARVYIHHMANTNYNAKRAATLHVNTNRWPGVGYHWIIEKDGRVVIGNPIKKLSYHAKRDNSKSIGVCLSGNFEQERPTVEQLKSLYWVLEQIKKEVPQPLEIVGHRDNPRQSTSCPGTYLYQELKSIRLPRGYHKGGGLT